MSKRVLIISDSIYRQTGYATVANNIIKHLDPSFKIAQLGLSHMPTKYLKDNNIDYYSPILNHSKCCNKGIFIEHYNKDTDSIEHISPNITLDVEQNICSNGLGNAQDPYCFESAFFVIQHFQPDIVITINDIWGMYKLNFLKNRKNFKFISYLAVDSECFPASIKTNETINTMQYISLTDKVVVFTDWAKDTINKTAKIVLNKEFDNIHVIPHGVDITKYNGLNNPKQFVRDFFNLDPDKVFLIGSVNRNQPRKRLDAVIQTLRILIDKYEKPDGKKFMVHFHCAIEDSHGWDLPWLINYYGVQDRVILDPNLKPGQGVPDHILNYIMNSYDVHFAPTNSEGWGLSIIETMACGVPNVISDYSAHGDWAKDAALKARISAKIHDPITNHIKGIIDIEHAAELIGSLYNDYKLQKAYRVKSFKLAESLQWANVCKDWNNLINNFDISDLKSNRYINNMIDTNTILPFPSNPLEVEFEVLEI